MNKKLLWITVRLCIMLSLCICICGCGSSSGSGSEKPKADSSEKRVTHTEFLMPEASGTDVFKNDIAEMDFSNISEGYCMVRYDGDASKVRLMITTPDGQNRYVYTVIPGDYETFPLSCGDGTYQINLCEQVEGDQYAVAASTSRDVALADEYRPFLYPNAYVWYTADSGCVKLGMEISDTSSGDLDFVEKVYNYVTSEISYDYDRAQNVQTDYIPDLDQVLAEKKGICFDYAALMTSILRSQGIPTKMVFGYSGTTYHAWISVYLKEVGWVDNMIEFNGKEWSLMDPTLAANASNSEKDVEKYIGDSSNYTEKFWY